MFVHYTGYAAKYDEWISTVAQNNDTLRIQKQWRRGMSFKLNNRVDVLDKMGKWLPAGIVDIETIEMHASCAQVAVKVHFVGYKPKWDEVIRLDDADSAKRIREIGAFSGAHGWAKYNQAY